MSKDPLTQARTGMVAAFVALAACSSAPSEAEIKAALGKTVGIGDVSKVKSRGCVARDDNFLCEIEMPMFGSNIVTPMVFTKGPNGWMVLGAMQK